MTFDKEAFETWLRNNTRLLESSIIAYAKVVQTYYNEYQELKLAKLKDYISHHSREANSMHVRAPWRYFFRMMGIDSSYYEQLPQPRKQPKKRQGQYLPEKILKHLIMSIDNNIYRQVSILRYYTGLRATESLRIKEEKISTINKEIDGRTVKFVRIIVEVKRGRERPIYLRPSLARKILGQFIQNKPGFLFLNREWNLYESSNKPLLAKKVKNEYLNYYRALNKAARKIGLTKKYGTHDIRRSFAEIMKRKVKDISIVQRSMHHSDIRQTLEYFDPTEDSVITAMLQAQGET